MAEISEVKIRLSYLLSAEVSANQLTLIQENGDDRYGNARTDRISLTPEQWCDLIGQLPRLGFADWSLPTRAKDGA